MSETSRTKAAGGVPEQPAKPAPPSLAKAHGVAKKLHTAKHVYAVYGVLNGLNDAYMIAKYSCDLLSTRDMPASDILHDWLTSSDIVPFMSLGIVATVGCSFVANYFDEKNKNKSIMLIAVVWPYLRELLKGLRYSYKGVRSILSVAREISRFSSTLPGLDLNYLLLPFGLVIGILSALNRIWHRRMYKQRKELKELNEKLLEKIQSITKENREAKEKKIDSDYAACSVAMDNQKSLKSKAIFSVAFGGFVDSLYQYMGILTLAALDAPLFIAMLSICIFFAIVNILTRIYEEQDYQAGLVVSFKKVELARQGRTLEKLCLDAYRCEELSQIHTVSVDNVPAITLEESFVSSLKAELEEFNRIRKELNAHVKLGTSDVVLAGLKLGLTFYSIITNMLFAISTIVTLFLGAGAFPAYLLILGVLSGLLILAGFTIYTNSCNKAARRVVDDNQVAYDTSYACMTEALSKLMNMEGLNELQDNGNKKEEAKHKPFVPDLQTFLGDLGVSPRHSDGHAQDIEYPGLLTLQNWYDAVRQIFSGAGKARQVGELLAAPLQEQDEYGHYGGSPEIAWITMVMSLVYSVSFGLRAFARVAKSPSPKVTHSDEKRTRAELVGALIAPEPSLSLTRNLGLFSRGEDAIEPGVRSASGSSISTPTAT